MVNVPGTGQPRSQLRECILNSEMCTCRLKSAHPLQYCNLSSASLPSNFHAFKFTPAIVLLIRRVIKPLRETNCHYKCDYLQLHLICIYVALFKSFFFFNKFIYLLLAALGLCCCARAFSSCGKRGPLPVSVHGPLIAVVSLVEEHRLQAHGLQ